MPEETYSENAYLKGRDHLEHLGVDGSIILKWILKRYIEVQNRSI
jgi:hypothetical protein